MFMRVNGKQKEVALNPDFICGVADAWGKETLCLKCDKKLKDKWAKEDLKFKDEMKGGLNNNDN